MNFDNLQITGQKLDFLVAYNFQQNCMDILMRMGNDLNGYAIAQPVEFSPYEVGAAILSTKPMLTITKQDARALMDAMWSAGIRPTEPTGEGVIKATQAHLEDMRKIAFSYIELQK